MKTFPLKHSLGTLEIDPTQIVRIESQSNYSKIYFNNRPPLLVCKILQWFEDQLSNQLFVRVHRSHLVNKTHISAKSDGSMVVLADGQVIPVSRRRRKVVL